MSAYTLLARVAAIAVLSLPFGAVAAEPPPSTNLRIEVRPPRVDEDTINKVQVGMNRNDVIAVVGSPDKMVPFPRSRTIAWDYNYTDAWGYVALFSVIFDDTSMVVSKVNQRRVY